MIDENESVRDKTLKLVTRNFSITKCPEKVFQDFSKFCKDETNDNYSFGLKMLLDFKNTNIKEVVLYEQYMEMKARVADLIEEINELRTQILDQPVTKEDTKESNKTFGKK